MTRWVDRPTEVANLLNPAFCGRLLIECAEQYRRPLPFEFAMLVLPIVLHRDTRTKLPRSVATSMLTWVERNPEVRVGFAERVRDLAPFTREALRFCLAHARLRFRPEAGAFEPCGFSEICRGCSLNSGAPGGVKLRLRWCLA
jgi:hypothetical protein